MRFINIKRLPRTAFQASSGAVLCCVSQLAAATAPALRPQCTVPMTAVPLPG